MTKIFLNGYEFEDKKSLITVRKLINGIPNTDLDCVILKEEIPMLLEFLKYSIR